MENKGLITVITDLLKNVWKEFFIVLLIAIVVGVIVNCFEWALDVHEFWKNVILSLPSLVGFKLAAFAILFSLDEETYKMLFNQANDGKHPFDVICSNLVLGMVIEIVVLSLSFLLKSLVEGCFLHILANSIVIYCIIWNIHCIFHMYSIRTAKMAQNKGAGEKM